MKKAIVFITLLLHLVFAGAFIDSFESMSVLLFVGLAVLQFAYFDHRAVKLTTFMFLFWIFTYYLPVMDLGVYYTPEQTFTDSNYYDFYALRFADAPFSEIITLADVTWQSTFVVAFYAFVYKIFGKVLLLPVVINLYFIYLSWYLIQVRRLRKKRHIALLYLMAIFSSTIYVMPGKDVFTTLFLSILMALSFSNYGKLKQLVVTTIFVGVSLINRFNTLPLHLFLELRRLRKSFSIRQLIPMGMFALLIFFVAESKLSFYLDIQTLVDRQREKSQFSGALINVLVPSNLVLYFLVTPLRFLAYLISPFPFYNKLFSTFRDLNLYFFYFQVAKFISGICWTYIIAELYLWRKRYDKRLLLIVLTIPLMISTVQLLQGGRYRVVCDLFYFWMLTVSYKEKRIC